MTRSGRFGGTWASGLDRMGLARAAGGRDPDYEASSAEAPRLKKKGRATTKALRSYHAFRRKGRAMTMTMTNDTDQGTRKSLWEKHEEERRHLGPALTAAQLNELRALGHQLLNPRSN